MRLQGTSIPHNNFALAVGAPSIDTKVDAANWPPSPRIPLKHHFRSIQILAPFILVGDQRQHSHPGHAILEIASAPRLAFAAAQVSRFLL